MRTGLRIGGEDIDVTGYVANKAAVRYAWGRRSEGKTADPSSCSLALLNNDGRFTDGNPLSPYYGQLTLNTPLTRTYAGPDVALVVPADAGAGVSTPDSVVLDTMADVDLRVDITPAAWRGLTANGGWEVMGKWGAVGQRSWMMIMSDGGIPVLFWSTDGSNEFAAAADAPIQLGPRERCAVRITMDVNNGLGGWTVTHYTAPTIAGPWTALGTPYVTTSGGTSIFNSTAPLEIGAITGDDFYAVIPRRYHAVEVRNGIAGAIVANPDFTTLQDGTTAFSDTANRAWTVTGATITRARTRAALEASDWTPQWKSDKDITTPIVAAGILRRLGQGRKPLSSTLRRTMGALSGGPVAYWPMEDGRTATQAASAVVGVQALQTQEFDFAADSACAGADALPTIGAAATMVALVPAHTSTTEGYTVTMMYSLDTLPASKSAILAFEASGTGHGIVISLTSTDMVCDVYSAANVLLATSSFATPGYGQDLWWRLYVTAQRNGANTDFEFGVEDATTSNSGLFSIAGTPGTVTKIATAFGALLTGAAVGHLAVYARSDTRLYWGQSASGEAGETSGERMLRLCDEEGIPLTIVHGGGDHTPMGPQRPAGLLDLLGEIEAADGGILYEDPDRLGLIYRTRTSLYSQVPALTIPYGVLVPPMQPKGDDQRVRNDRTVQRQGGSFARAVLETGPKSTSPPPDGVGLYQDSTTLNVHQDSQLQDIAYWLLHRGTWNEARYPRVRIALHKHPELIPAVTGLQPGSVIRITDLPPWLPAGPVDLMVEGGEDEQDLVKWYATLACSPAGPWNVALAGDATYAKADTTGTVLGAAAGPQDSTLVVHTEQTAVAWSRPLFSQDPAEYPVTLKVGGEEVIASAATSLAADTFTRTVAAGGWGTASDGLHTYTLTGGVSSAERSVASGRGVVTVSASQTLHRQQTIAETCMDADVRCQMAVSATATGGTLNACVLLRWTSSTAHYRARLEFTTGGAVNVSVTNGSSIIGSNASTGLTYAPGDVFEVRVRIIGFRILMRVWRTGTTEPVLWHIDRTDVADTNPSGTVGLSCHGGTGNTNTGLEYRFDGFLVESPQRLTVARSTNGIFKPHAAGTRVALALPARAAL
ncbi:hypothetical protein ACFCYM_09695 [Streptomyces sp. NPDC056254]|uniref:hypothetical protein n=1 Tax=Streptomyces sp. NPDC056254 TaxID=3345763 RepID=UPI0035D533B0